MVNQVFANGMEIACKAGAGKVIAAFPDVCFTPPDKVPPTPLGVPVPYPNTGFSSDTAKGSKKVKISKKEIMLKNKSYFKKSTGDEAGCTAKKGVISSKNKGKVYFIKWSMDVKIEGKNVDRHLDMTTNNHGSPMANEAVPWVFIDSSSIGDIGSPCGEQVSKERAVCGKVEKKVQSLGLAKNKLNKAMREAYCSDPDCRNARKCMLQPEVPDKKSGESGCCKSPPPKMTPHHIIPAHCFMRPGVRNSGNTKRYSGCDGYDSKKAPCICVIGKDKCTGDHKKIHDLFDPIEDSHLIKTTSGKILAGSWEYQEAAHAGCVATAKVTKCDPSCLRAQVDGYHQKGSGKLPNIDSQTGLRAETSGNRVRNPIDYHPDIPEVIHIGPRS